MILRRNSLCVLLFPSSRELGKSSDQREPFQQMIKFLLKFTPWLQKKEKEKCLRFDFIICLFILLFFSDDDHKELLVCINSRHFNLCLGGLFALNNAEPTFKIILVRLRFAHSQLFLFFYGIIVCIWIKMQIKCAVKVEHTGIDLKGEI